MKNIFISIILFRLFKHSDELPTLQGAQQFYWGEGSLCPSLAAYGPDSIWFLNSVLLNRNIGCSIKIIKFNIVIK